MNMPPAEPVSNESKVSDRVSNTVNNASEGMSSLATNMSENVNNASEYVKDSMSSFEDSDLVGSSGEFLKSNSLIAKFSFLILVLIGFMIILNLGIRIIRS